MKTEHTLLLASSRSLQLVIRQLQAQGFFTFLSEQVACTIDELGALSDVSPQALLQTLNLMVALGVLSQNEEGEYGFNELTQAYLHLITLPAIDEYASLEAVLSSWQERSSQLEPFSEQAQLSLMAFVHLVLVKLQSDNCIVQSAFISWERIPQQLAELIQSLFIKLAWLDNTNPSLLTQEGQQAIQTIDRFNNQDKGSVLTLFPQGLDLIHSFSQQLQASASEYTADCVVFVVDQSQFELVTNLAADLGDLSKILISTSQGNVIAPNGIDAENAMSYGDVLAKKASRFSGQYDKVLWVVVSPNTEARKMAQIVTHVSTHLPPVAVESLLVSKDKIDNQSTIFNACVRLLNVDISYFNQSVTEQLSAFIGNHFLPTPHASITQASIGDLKVSCTKLSVSNYTISLLSQTDVRAQNVKHLGLTARQAKRLIVDNPQWQFKISTATDTAFLLTRMEVQGTAQRLHIIHDQTSDLSIEDQTLLTFIYSLAELSGRIDAVVFNGQSKQTAKGLSVIQQTKLTAGKDRTVSIVGYALKTAGADDTDAFWQLHQGNEDAISDYAITDRVSVAKGKANKKVYKGGLLSQPIDSFDAEFFGITAVEAAYLDPQQRLLLETTWHALEHAGVTQQQLSQSKTGIFVGASNQDFAKLVAKHGDATQYNRYVNAGGHNGTLAGRLAYFLKTRQQSIVIDTACASSMTALHQAKMSLQRGDIDYAIVAGVNIILTPEFTEGDNAMGVISQSGQVRSFSDDADGYVRSEGIAVVVLTKAELAVENQLVSHANLLATQVNQESSAKYFSMPAVGSQVAVMRQALTEAGLTPDDIDVVEAHATATIGGDAIELNALAELHGEHPLLLSSSKPIIGHTEAPSGLIGLIKMMMAMKHEVIPAQLHFDGLNQRAKGATQHLQVVDAPRLWKHQADHQRVAAVTSLSYSGANAHAILSEPTQLSLVPALVLRKRWVELGGALAQFKQPQTTSASHFAPLVISAKTSDGLNAQVASFIDYLSKLDNPDVNTWLNTAYTSTACRDHFQHRLIIVADSIEGALEQLKKPIEQLIQPCEQLSVESPLDFAGLQQRYLEDMVFQYAVDRYWPTNKATLDKLSVESFTEIERFIINQANYYCYQFVGLTKPEAMMDCSMIRFLQDIQVAYQGGGSIHWSHVWFSQIRTPVELPKYAFQHQSYWPAILGGKTDFFVTSESSKARNKDDEVLLTIFADLTNRKVDNIDVSFFDIGGNSLKLSDLKHHIAMQFGVDIPLKNLFNLNTVRQVVDSLPEERQSLKLEQIEPNPSLRHQPFPLTPIQQAYAYGRELPAQMLGGVSTHLYYEIDWQPLDLARFEQSFNAMIQRHDMMRAIINESGQQVVLDNPGYYAVKLHDFSGLDAAAFNQKAEAIRGDLSHEKFNASQWPLFKVEVVRGAEKDRILLSFDCLIIDMFSLHTLMREWFQAYQHPETRLEPLSLTFRDYVQATAKPSGPSYDKAKSYWLTQVPKLAPAPELPFKTYPSELTSLSFTRVSKTIPESQWKAIKDKAAEAELSPTSVLLSLFAAVVAKWSTNKSFLLNLTLFTRQRIHEQVQQILGDFTETELLSVDTTKLAEQSLYEFVGAIHNRLWEDLDNNAFQGVDVAREIIKQRQLSDAEIVSPVVFTSLLNLGGNDQSSTWLAMDKMAFGITQTPQVHLDHKTFEQDGALVAEWDYPVGLFDDALITDMHTCYCELIEAIATMDWQLPCPEVLPEWQKAVIHYEPTKQFPDAERGLHHLFDQARKIYPNKVAIVSEDRNITYQQLYATAQTMAKKLVSLAAKDELIAVLCPPGWRQVAACLAIQYAGGAYLPMEATLPEKYLADLLVDTDAKALISCEQFSDLQDKISEGKAITKLKIDEVVERCGEHIEQGYHSDNLAYVIFTSGSTGKPKGVKITHRSAVNTVLDMNDRFGVTEDDKAFAVSKLNFDLSVYDIYGLLAVGGQIVYPGFLEDKEPAKWFELCQQHEVTIWNSVPKIVEMLMSYMAAKAANQLMLPSLRLVMMSGDWIPLQLPEKISAFCPNPNLVRMSLGGATEGSIWSIGREIHAINPKWTSIPYGRALTNQTMMILDEHMFPLPVGVEGDIYIGGIGVAQGYWRNEEKTFAAFKRNPLDGQMIYKTGDRGYKDAEGEIIFCGRVDSQVKINGYRVELGGITTCLNKIQGIADSAVLDIDEQGGKRLVAFVRRGQAPQFKELMVRIQSPLSSDEKSEFKRKSQGLFHQQRLQGAQKVSLTAAQTAPTIWYARKSYRRFDGDKPITETDLLSLMTPSAKPAIQSGDKSLSALLSVCAASSSSAHVLPKYAYPSAGSTYPVKVYALVGKGHEKISAGCYYYHAEEHALYKLNDTVPSSGLSIVTVSHDDLIQPLYGQRGIEFSDYEQGHIYSLLSQAANQLGWALEVNDDDSQDLTALLNLGDNDRVLAQTRVHTQLLERKPSQALSNEFHTYVYIQKNCTLAEGLYEMRDGAFVSCDVKSPYPIAFDHPGDNASVIADAQAIIFISAQHGDASKLYQNMGTVTQDWMLNAPDLSMGLCTMGLPLLPEALCQAIKGTIHMAYAIGRVSPSQLLDKQLSMVKPGVVNKGQYLEEQLRAQQMLPSYAIPSAYIEVDAVPLTANGKVDRRKLMVIYEEKAKKTGAISHQSKSKVVLDKGQMSKVIELIEQTANRQIDISLSWEENGIRSFNSVALKVALEEYGLLLTNTLIVKDDSIEVCINKMMASANLVEQEEQAIPQPVALHNNNEPIAIIGMSGRFPGANGLDAYWRLLCDGIDGLTYYPDAKNGQMKSCGPIEGMLAFDNDFFRISPRAAGLMHPGQRVWLETVWHALEDASYAGDRADERVGVYATLGGDAYLHASYYEKGGLLTRTVNEHDYFATRSAYAFDFTGPVLTLQSACSSSLAAIHLAVNALRTGEATIMVAGGVHTSRFMQMEIANYPQNTIFSAQGHCQPYSSSADGIIESQGVGAVVLKPLFRALADGDRVYATVLGSALNNDGSHKRDFTSPNGDAQRDVISRALQAANVPASTITAIEGHGTGTPMGDPIEFEALRAIYGKTQPVALSSVKGNIGHTVTAAGVAGVMRMAMSLKYGVLPQSLYLSTPNPELRIGETRFDLTKQTKPWQTSETVRRGGVSSFGMGGTNAHAILEEAPETTLDEQERLVNQWQGVKECQAPSSKSSDDGPWLFVLSAKTPTALATQVHQLKQRLDKPETVNLADLSYTLSVGRAQMVHRFIVEASDVEQLRQMLSKPMTVVVSESDHRQGFKAWYQSDAYYRALVDSCSDIFASIDDLGKLSDAIAVEETTPALTLIFQYNALRRYQACGLSLDKFSATGSGTLAHQIISGDLRLEQALTKVEEVGDLKIDGIHIADGQASLRQAIQQSFRKGATINWRGYWRGSVRQKVDAPLYPFERTQFWHQSESVSPVVMEEKSHGLLQGKAIAVSDEQWLFQQELSLTDPSLAYLSQHRVLSAVVFPGSGYTELLLSAARSLDEDVIVEISELTYRDALQLVEGETRICQVVLQKREDGNVEASILSFVAGTSKNQALMHAQGVLAIKLGASQQRQPHVDVARLANQFTVQKDVNSVYSGLTADGVHYGELFRGIRQFAQNVTGNLSLARIELDKSMTVPGHSIHPVLLDNAFQSLASILLSKQANADVMTYIPVGHGKVRFYGDMAATGYAWGRITSAPGAKELTGDLAIYTELGDLSVMITGLRLAPVPKAILQKRFGISAGADIHYQLELKKVPIFAIGAAKRTWLLVGDHGNVANPLKAALKAKGDAVKMINIADSFEPTQMTGLGSSVGVIYLDGLQSIQPSNQAHAAWQLLQLVNQLAKQTIRINRFMVVSDNELDHGIYRGFCTSLSAARPGWQVSLVEVDDCKRADIGQLLSSEARQDSNAEMMICYRGRERLAGRISRFKPTIPTPLVEKLFGPDDNCLVTGGLGGLGLKVSEWLISKGARHLVLLTRQQKQALPTVIQHWQANDIDVVTQAVDVSDKSALAEVIGDIKSKRLQLAGVFHLAGVIRDVLIDKLVEQDFEQVFAPKVLGSQHLHDLTVMETALRYFVLFSSLVSMIGSAGQVNYAAANSYMDALSERRQAMGLPVQRINYGAWAEVGMAPELSSEQKRTGMDQISVDEGLKAMEISMVTGKALTCARVNWADIWRKRRQFGLVSGLMKPAVIKEEKPTDNLVKQLSATDTDERLSIIKRNLQQHIANDLGVDIARIETDMGINEIVKESLRLKSVSDDMEEDWGELITIDDATLLDYPTIDALAAHINAQFKPSTGKSARADLDDKEQWRHSLSRELKIVYHGNVKMATMFMTQDINSYEDANGRTALYVAVASGKTEMVAWLLEKGADKNAQTNTGISVMEMVEAVDLEEIAIQFGHASQQFRG